jgi:hypothetical protein
MKIHYVSQKNAMFLSTNICEFTKNITPVVPFLQKCNFFEPVLVKSLKYIATSPFCVTRGSICIIQCEVLVILRCATSNAHPNDKTYRHRRISQKTELFSFISPKMCHCSKHLHIHMSISEVASSSANTNVTQRNH